jgi:hypothetical protein
MKRSRFSAFITLPFKKTPFVCLSILSEREEQKKEKRIHKRKKRGIMTALPPVVPKSPAAAGSSRSSQRSAGKIAAAVDDAVQSVRSSQRSAAGSQRSITSSVALSKLAALETLLLEERKARENAENTLLGLQRERILREEAAKQSECTQKQLNDLLTALKAVVVDPDNPACVRKLQGIIQGRDTPLNGSRLPTPAAAVPPPPPPLVSVLSSKEKEEALASLRKSGNTYSEGSSNLGRPRHFLDALGQYERQRDRERKKAAAAGK